jgi:hypothetical protein
VGAKATKRAATRTVAESVAAKTRENRLRRMADRQGFVLRKSRRRDPQALDFGTYQLVDLDNDIVLGDGAVFSGFGCDLDEIEEWLNKPFDEGG